MILVAMWSLAFWAWLLIFLGLIIVGFVIGMLVTRKITAKYMEKNPPINEKMIRVMYQQMGRTPTEKQVRQVMSAVNSQSGNSDKKK